MHIDDDMMDQITDDLEGISEAGGEITKRVDAEVFVELEVVPYIELEFDDDDSLEITTK